MSTPRAVLAVSLLLSWLAVCCASQPKASPAAPRPLAAGWTQQGIASWYGGSDGFEGKPTASGEIYDGSQLTAAHRELPLGTVVDVTNLENGKTVRVRVNDRGPFVKGRVIDLSRTAAREVDLIGPGTAPVRLSVVMLGAESEPLSPTGQWSVQAASFADRGRAERFAERLRGVGHGVYLEPYRGLSRVKVGPFDSRKRAGDALDQLHDEGFEGIVVPASQVTQVKR